MKKTLITIFLCILGTMGVLGLTIGGMYILMPSTNATSTKNITNNTSNENIDSDSPTMKPENNILDTNKTNSANNHVTVYIFRGEGCPHCTAAEAYFKTILPEYDYLDVKMYETWKNPNNKKLKEQVCNDLNNEDCVGVPLIVIGDYYLAGFLDSFDLDIRTKITEAHDSNTYTDIVSKTIANNSNLDIVEENLK